MTYKKKFGNMGENLVAKFLEEKKFKILEKNYRTRSGEIDIIAKKGKLLSFIEVKTRKKEYFSTSMVVNYPKQRKIINTAKRFISEKNISDMIFRFDIAIVIISNKNTNIEYIPDAFGDR